MMHASGETGIPAFLTKLWTLVDDPSTDELICWDATGHSFHILEQGRFAKELLPHYFKHNNIASFVRQLNMYGFRKIVKIEHGGLKVERDDMEFAHQYFIRDQENLVEHIKRKVTNVKSSDDVKVKPGDVNKVLSDVRGIRGKQDLMNKKLETLERENETLWREVSTLRQKHMKQQQIVNKLIQFLITMVGRRPVRGVKRKVPLMLEDSTQLEHGPPKIATLPIEGGQTAYHVQSPESVAVSPGTLTIHEVTDSVPGQPDGQALPQVPSYQSISTHPLSTDKTSQAGRGINTHLEENLTAVNPSQVLPPADGGSTVVQPQVVALSVDSSDLNSQQQVVTIPISSTNSGAAIPVQMVLVPATGGTAIAPAGMAGTILSSRSTEANQFGKSLTTGRNGVAGTGEQNSDLVPAVEAQELPLLASTSTSKEDSVCQPSILKPKHEMCKELQCCNRSEVEEHVEGTEMEIDMLRDLIGDSYNLDSNLVTGLFTPEVPMPSAPETLLNLEGVPDKDSTTGTELMAYNPQADDFSQLFDFGLPEESTEGNTDNASLDIEGLSGLQTPTIYPSTPMPEFSVTSALAEKRHSPQKVTTEEVD